MLGIGCHVGWHGLNSRGWTLEYNKREQTVYTSRALEMYIYMCVYIYIHICIRTQMIACTHTRGTYPHAHTHTKHKNTKTHMREQQQDRLIHENIQQRTSSVLLVGRSGTGKTTIGVARMWAFYSAHAWIMENLVPEERNAPENAYHQVFVTANAVLRDRVRAHASSCLCLYVCFVSECVCVCVCACCRLPLRYGVSV
jgi:hypothetical protein